MEKKTWLASVAVVVVFVSGVVAVKTLISNEVVKRTQLMQELNAHQLAEVKLKCETEKVDQETQLKKQIVDLQAELEKSKILIEKIQKRGKVTEQIKKDVDGFIKSFDALVGTKGKTNEK
jgi:hypothetical protein